MKLTTLSTGILLALGSLTTTAYADDLTSTDQAERIEIKGSYISGYNAHSASGASKLELPIAEIPQSVTVITAQQIEDFRLTDINDVLNTATGVNVESVETDRTYYTARGFDVTNFQIDGVGLPLAYGNNQAGDDTAIYDRVEVIAGANGLMTGVGNPSATINYIRKRPVADTTLSVAGTYGSWDSTRVEVDGSTQINDTFAVRAVATADNSGSHLDRYSTDKYIAYVFFEANISEDTQLSLSHSYTRNDAEGNLWGALPLYYTDGTATDYSRSTSTSADWSNWEVTRHNTVLELAHQFSDSWNLRATYSHRDNEEDSELFYVWGTPDSETELGLYGYASEYLNDQTSDLFDIYVSGDFELLGRTHELVVGGTYDTLEWDSQSLYDYENGFPAMPDLNTWKGEAPTPTWDDGLSGADVEQTQKAVYATARFELADGLNVTAGGRYNDWEVEGESYGVDQEASADEFIPYLGVIYRVLPELVAYASYTETFVSQTELGINDKTLAPITGESSEIGLKAELFEGRLLATAAYFDIEQTNVAVVHPDYVDLPPDEVRYYGADGISSDGFEFNLAGEVAEGLNVSMGYTDFNIDGDDTVSDYTPKKLFKLSAVYDLPMIEGLSAGANMRWQDDISRVQGVVGEGFANAGDDIVTTQSDYAIVDLMARYDINDKVSVSFNAFNITDEKYLTSLYWAQGFYGAPANYSATLSWKL
ncbi:TonB-dependent siderophore receptor [Neiella marina]|uniref:TonB-dependent siderophore receptor n=1 Tax=Neiella holothuriorum TaxID=2870530 RepID=A0ABS7EKM0_9GAMM|nr:TonB-dependent siderophore receptor [Neiella holothuriorum]MBW8192906.1 TonB-dependent siderophore receptor [Neiella holothuriorum]